MNSHKDKETQKGLAETRVYSCACFSAKSTHLKILSKSSTEVLAIVGYLESITPAELTMMWTGELNTSWALSKRDLTWVGSETSARTVMASGVFGEQEEEELIWEATRSAWAELEV